MGLIHSRHTLQIEQRAAFGEGLLEAEARLFR